MFHGPEEPDHFVLAIAVTVFAAVFVSLGLPALTGRAPEVVLPDVNQEAVSTEGRDFLPVEVRPDTVQSVIVVSPARRVIIAN